MAVSKPFEEDPLAKLPLTRQETEEYLATNALKTSSQKSVVVFGMAGHGKNTFLNFIIRQKGSDTRQEIFSVDKSVTKETVTTPALVEGQQFLLIDTPGFMDTERIEDSIERSPDMVMLCESEDFRRNILRAYLDAGEEVGAFILVYSLTARWTAEVTQMMEFLESVSFPWDHCIVVLTHGDHSFPNMPEKERYKALKEAIANDKLPNQLKQLIKNSNDRALIVESSRTNDKEYYHSVMKKFLALISGIPGPYSNPHFLHFAQLVKKSQQSAYKAVLQDKKSLSALEAKTRVDFENFQSTVEEVSIAQKEFIEYLHKIADMINTKIFTPRVTAAAGFGAAACVAGIAAILLGVGLLPVTFGASTAAVTGGVVVAAGGVGAATIPPIIKWLRNHSEYPKVQKSFAHAIVIMEGLYQLYQKIMQKIQEDSLGHNHPEVHSLLFAHLAGVHMHGVKDKGDELCETAENLTVYHRLRKQAKEQSESGSKSSNSDFKLMETSPNYAIPVGFNLLARGFDVAYTVGTTVEVAQISKESKKIDTQILRDTCIVTLEKEMHTIKLLCKAPNQ
jgi:GTP-binding protein EngB required for normal cell division